eukprot:GILK01001600.1.p1 GENE.GILK01001600.1~~GILK01001600.1.p1  ORF type:complete len:543 (+),score=80.11 GILK01001600.1:139-1629(+)
MDALAKAAKIAILDPARPTLHFRPPANWFNDPNGPLFFKGVYHLFYQLTPDSDEGNIKYWGHARSTDLVHWTHLPIAVWPSVEADEDSCWSGTSAINGDGTPMLIYTSISDTRAPEVWASLASDVADTDLAVWEKLQFNPLFDMSLHKTVRIDEWRDPFHFSWDSENYIVMGGKHGDKGVVNLYHATDRTLTNYEYKGIMFVHPLYDDVECPLFIPLDGQFVLFTSAGWQVQYFIGQFEDAQFSWTSQGIVDYGAYYAPNIFVDDSKSTIMGWVNGFQSGKAWNGVASLPRTLSIRDGILYQTPAEALRDQRIDDETKTAEAYLVAPATVRVRGFEADLFEVNLKVAFIDSYQADVGLAFPPVAGFTASDARVVIHLTNSSVTMGGHVSPFTLLSTERTLNVRMFVDRSVMEVYINNRFVSTALIEYAVRKVDVVATSGTPYVTVSAVPLKPVWPGPPSGTHAQAKVEVEKPSTVASLYPKLKSSAPARASSVESF